MININKINMLLCCFVCCVMSVCPVMAASADNGEDEEIAVDTATRHARSLPAVLPLSKGEGYSSSLRESHVNGDFALCAKNFPENNVERLKCFDRALGSAAQVAESVHPVDLESEHVVDKRNEVVLDRSYLTRLWNLDNLISRDSSSLDRLQPHRQSYLIVRQTDHVNNRPVTPAPGRTVLIPYDMDAMETKFQLSFKNDILTRENLDLWGLKTFRLWGAYTQQSHWQVINTRNSSPFRETNYEPELIAAFGTGNASGWKLLNLGLEHQSNGRTNPDSRSWNRVYAQGGWEWGNTSLLARGWWRIPENALKDDNPDIVHYMGRGDLVVRWEPDSKGQSVALLLRNNLNLNQNLGFVQLDWSMPLQLGKAARLHAQMGSGYGESLLDYNHRQTTIGLGVSFREW
jgi:phospholipase A1